jgi:uncharacterized protein
MPYSTQELNNLQLVKNALGQASHDFTRFFDLIFSPDCQWTIAGHGPVARTYDGMNDLFANAEADLFARFAEPLAIESKGVWADGDGGFLLGYKARAVRSMDSPTKTNTCTS